MISPPRDRREYGWAATPTQTIDSPDGVNGDHFGEALAIDGDYLLIGAPRHDSSGTDNDDRVSVYKRNDRGTWNLLQQLTPPIGTSHTFGNAVALDGSSGTDWAIIGAKGRGEVYMFRRDSQSETYLAAGQLSTGDGYVPTFGGAVSLRGSYAAVTSSRYVYIFRCDAANSWSRRARLIGPSTSADVEAGALTIPITSTSLVAASGASVRWLPYDYADKAHVYALPSALVGTLAAIHSGAITTLTLAENSALAQVEPPFHQTIDGTPGVDEYGDLQRSPEGVMSGVMKRAYTYTREGEWRLVTGDKVGDLVTGWISQVQYNPEVIGSVEGAPPVPSEPLTADLCACGARREFATIGVDVCRLPISSPPCDPAGRLLGVRLRLRGA